jgi:hypothetical protein
MTAQVIPFAPYLARRNALVFDPIGHVVTTFWLALLVGMAAVAVLEWE